MTNRRTAYSYIRFSNERQQLGDSLRRQVALAEEYAARHDMVLDTHSYRDMGISAYKGRNAIEGKLATFMRAVDGGHIPANSFLLVESLDRLSRHDVDEALELFLSIVRRGVTIVTLTDNQVYSRDSIKRDHGISLIISITIMMRAHEESATKSRRNKEAWKAKTARGGILTSISPSWLRLVNGRWQVIEAKAKIVRRIFELAQQGYGALTIQRILNSANVPTMKSAQYWSPGLVTKILSSQSVYGTLTRTRARADPIPDYYPIVVPRETFDRVRMMARARNWTAQGPTRAKASNLFVGMSFCGGCGARLIVSTGTGGRYILRCKRAFADAGCAAVPVHNKWIESALFEELLRLQPAGTDEKSRNVAAADEALDVESKLTTAQADRDQLIRLALANDGAGDMAARLAGCEVEISALRARLASARRLSQPADQTDIDQARHLCAAIVGGRTLPIDLEPMREKLALRTRRMFASMHFDPVLPEVTLIYETGRTTVVTYQRPAVAKERLRSLRFVPRYLRSPQRIRSTAAQPPSVLRSVWLRRFVLCLQQLLPTLNWDVPLFGRVAQATYLEAFDLLPEEAAEIFSLDVTPAIVGAPGD